ncbi:MAG: hypothetical protein ABWY14_13865 [Tardiphaga sp.]
MAKYETTDYAQMRRCRMAHLHGRRVDERFNGEANGVVVSGFIHAIRPDLTRWPLQWTITVEQQSAQALAMAD